MNKMKKFFVLVILASFLLGYDAISQETYVFTETINIPVTPVKDQQITGTCWSFATTSFIEAELLRTTKKEFDLAEMYFVRNAYIDKAENYVRRHGLTNFGQGGQAHDVINQIADFGFITQEAYPGNTYDPGTFNHSELDAVLNAMLDVFVQKKNRKLTTVWEKAYTGVVDTYLGEIPESFIFEGKKQTPQEFAKSTKFNPDDYVEITSFLNYDFYKKVILEVPDNWSNDLYYNIPLDELVEVMKNSLDKGYTIVWDGDMSHSGFSHKNNIAIVPVEKTDFTSIIAEKEITPELRQQDFDNLTTTDDHLMHITGLAKDQKGTIYFKTKNSWGADSNKLGGYLYMSEQFIRQNTIAVLVHKNAIPDTIKKKLGL